MTITHTSAATTIAGSKDNRHRILMVHCEYQQQGGESVVVSEEVQLLKEAGHVVELLTFSNSGGSLWKLLQLPFNAGAYWTTLRRIRQFRPTVMHIHNLHFAGTASVVYAAKKLGVPIVMTLHNFRLLCPSATLFHNGRLFLHSLNENFCRSAIQRGAYQQSKWLTGWLAISMWLHQRVGTHQLIDQFIVLSPHAARVFSQSKLQLHANRLNVKPNFATAPYIIFEQRQDHFLFVGRLSAEKGIDLLLEVFSATGDLLKIAGDGPLQTKVLEYAGRFPNIIYLGKLSKSDINRAMRRCAALVFPSIWYEGMPLTIIEAFACGTPVIASNLGAMATMIRHGVNGLHFEAGDVLGLKAALVNFKLLPDKTALGENAFITYQRLYTPERNLHQLELIYNKATIVHEKVAVK